MIFETIGIGQAY